MSNRENLYQSVYDNFAHSVLAKVRSESFGEDIGQNSWLTVDEYRRFLGLLDLNAETLVLDICCGSGGPALFMARETGCRVTGIDVSDSAIRDALRQSAEQQNQSRVNFAVVDASKGLPFESAAFDAVISIDAINHLPDREASFRDFHRILKPGGRLLFTDPITVTGILSSEEIAVRSQISPMSFTPKGEDERLLRDAGFEVLLADDVTDNMSTTSRRRQDAREKYRDELISLEGEAVFQSMQRFLTVAHKVSIEGRLSRFVFLARRPLREPSAPI